VSVPADQLYTDFAMTSRWSTWWRLFNGCRCSKRVEVFGDGFGTANFVLAPPTSINSPKSPLPANTLLCPPEAQKVAMIVRGIARCSATRRLIVCRPRLLQAKPRRYSTSTSSTPAPNGASQASMLGAFTSELDRIAPKFEIQGSQIQILRTPSEFYETLKVGTWHLHFGEMC